MEQENNNSAELINKSAEHINEQVEIKKEPEIDYKAELEKAQTSLKEKDEQYKQLEKAKEKELLAFLYQEQKLYPFSQSKTLFEAYSKDRENNRMNGKKEVEENGFFKKLKGVFNDK